MLLSFFLFPFFLSLVLSFFLSSYLAYFLPSSFLSQDPNAVAGHNDTALNHAVQGHDLRLMKLLVASNADLVPEPPSLKSAILT